MVLYVTYWVSFGFLPIFFQISSNFLLVLYLTYWVSFGFGEIERKNRGVFEIKISLEILCWFGGWRSNGDFEFFVFLFKNEEEDDAVVVD